MRRTSLWFAACGWFVIAALPTVAQTSAQSLDPFARCFGYPAPQSADEKIAACTMVITGDVSPDERALAYEARANIHRTRREYNAAIDDYTHAIELQPDRPALYAQRCQVFVRQRDFDRALRDCDKAVELAPNGVVFLIDRSEAFDAMKRYDRALADLNHAIAVAPAASQPLLLRRRGLVYRHMRDYPRAIDDFTASLRLLPRDWEALNDRGLTYYDLDDLDRAIGDFNAAIALKPNFALAYGNRALCYGRREDYRRAISELDQAISLDPNEPAFYHNRAQFHLYLEEYDLAILDAERALKLRPGIGHAADFAEQARMAKAAIAARKLSPRSDAHIALVIGNSHYRFGPPLPNPVHDAEDIARELSKLGYKIYGYPKTDFTRAQLLGATREFFEAAKTAHAALIWYSGHGQEFVEVDGDFGRNWIIPTDAYIETSADIRAAGVTLGELLTAVMPAKALRMVVVDACRDNVFKPAIPFRGFAREGRLGMVVVYSTKPGATAADGSGRNSPFAAAFVRELQANPRGDVRALLDKVARVTRATTHDRQQPEIVDRYDGSEMPVLVH